MTIDPTNAGGAGLVDRAKNIILTPAAEWDRIAAEPADVQKIYTGYVLPLAAFSALCGFIGAAFIGVLGWRIGIVPGLVQAILQTALALCSVFVLAFIINALASSFGSRADTGQAHKLAAYGSTAFFLAGVFGIFPPLAILSLVGLYSFALIYIGMPRLMGTPEDKRIVYLIVVIVVAIVVQLVLGTIVGSLMLMVPGYAPPNPFGV
jgi:Yip1 domain